MKSCRSDWRPFSWRFWRHSYSTPGGLGPTSGAVRGSQFGPLMGIFVAGIHPISNLITMNMDTKLGLEIAVSNVIGWVLAGLVIDLVYKPLAPSQISQGPPKLQQVSITTKWGCPSKSSAKRTTWMGLHKPQPVNETENCL